MSMKTPELRAALKAFALEALKCSNPNFENLKFERFRLHAGIAFEISDEAIKAQQAFVSKAMKKLGPVRGHAKVIDKALWDIVVSLEKASQLDKPDFLNSALEKIQTESASVSEFFRPCPLVHLPPKTDRIEIGRVAIDRTAARIDDFSKVNKQLKFAIGNEWSLSFPYSSADAGVVAQLPPTLWSINLAAADPVREEEGLWLTDVALSILRLAVKTEYRGRLAPKIGEIEPHPFHPHDIQDNSFCLKQGGAAKLGGLTAANNYRLESEAAATLSDPVVKAKIDKIFEAKPQSIAERFYQGCGWMTRGRRSMDRSDRLLYFFTAIESLLSDPGHTSPVTETIARHAAVLLSDDNAIRQSVAVDVKQLYGIRSALVHTGSRGVFDIDSNSVQQIAERIFMRIWDDFDLSLGHQEFSNVLKTASYGIGLEVVMKA
jgi:hypothetical protein